MRLKSFVFWACAPAMAGLAGLGPAAAQSSRWQQEGYAVHGLAETGAPGRERVQAVSRWSGRYGAGAVYNVPEPTFAPPALRGAGEGCALL